MGVWIRTENFRSNVYSNTRTEWIKRKSKIYDHWHNYVRWRKADGNIKVLAVVQRTGAIFNSWYVATKFLQASQSTRNSNSILHKDEEKMRIEMPPKPETVMDLQKGPYTSHKMCSVVSQNWDSTEVRSLPILFSAKDSCNIWSGIVLLAESFASQLQYHTTLVWFHDYQHGQTHWKQKQPHNE